MIQPVKDTALAKDRTVRIPVDARSARMQAAIRGVPA